MSAQNDYDSVIAQWASLEVTNEQHLLWQPPTPLFIRGVSFSKPVRVKQITLNHEIIALRDDDSLMAIPAKHMPHPLSPNPVTEVRLGAARLFLPGQLLTVFLASPEDVVATLEYEHP